ncbi:MAG: hypothetical protein AB1515_04115 [Nitrospirota bacterium]
MKHLFYIAYVLTYSGAVFVGGMFVGQLLARHWARQSEEAARETAEHAFPVVPPLRKAPSDRLS